jgi:hypothetical protein
MNHRYPDVFISAGTTVPVTVIASQYDANHGGMTDGLGGGTFPQNQDGDTITGAATTTTPGQVGVPALWRDPGTPTKFIIPTAPTLNAGQLIVISQPICGAIFDVTSGAGAAVDSGVIVYTSTDSSLMIEIVATAALTGTRNVDVRKVRTDGSQYSLFDPVRNTAATYSLAIGRVNYLACLGVPVGGSAQAAAGTQNSMDHIWGFPLELGGGSGIRVVLTAGGAETVRVRILERRNSAV